MKAITLKSFLNGRKRVRRGEVIDVDEARFQALNANGLVRATEALSEPVTPPKIEAEGVPVKPKQTRRPKKDNA